MRFQKKAGPGRFYLRAGRGVKLVRPGEIIDCEPEDLGKHIDQFQRLDPEPAEPEPKQTVGLILDHRGGGRYNVINESTGEPINDRLLSKDEAEALIDGATSIDESGENMDNEPETDVADESGDASSDESDET